MTSDFLKMDIPPNPNNKKIPPSRLLTLTDWFGPERRVMMYSWAGEDVK